MISKNLKKIPQDPRTSNVKLNVYSQVLIMELFERGPVVEVECQVSRYDGVFHQGNDFDVVFRAQSRKHV